MAANEHNAPDQPQVRRPETSDALYDGYLGALRSTDGAEVDDLLSEYSAPAAAMPAHDGESPLSIRDRPRGERSALIREAMSVATRIAWVVRHWRYRLPQLWHSE